MSFPFSKNSVLLQENRTRWLLFQDPERIISAGSIRQVLPALESIETLVHENGWHAAGFLSYEAAPAFDPALPVHDCPGFPLLWFGLFPSFEILDPLPDTEHAYELGPWHTSVTRASYDRALGRIRAHLANGATYQVNYTIRLHAAFSGHPPGLFRDMIMAQQAMHGAYVDTGDFTVCSASPELFFSLKDDVLVSKPMKGTAPRGKTHEQDMQLGGQLRSSEKNRAENVMIVDMMRNDMGRIAIPGSVEVPALFDIEKFPTVWQMTSTVSSRTRASVCRIIQALFPCASVTGAPKPHTMQIIRELEPSPRRIYTGAIGMIGPGRSAHFNVAIRTVLIDRIRNRAEYGVGGGIVWDSTASEEYGECLLKARVLTERRPPFQLLESLLWTPETGYDLLEHHMKRLSASAAYFDFPCDTGDAVKMLESAVRNFPRTPLKVRLLLDRLGAITLNHEPPKPSHPVRIRLARTPVDTDNVFLYHKTTIRTPYDQALTEKGDAEDVILWNERDEITEASSSNIVVRFGEKLVTPPVSCGLLAGTRRAELLEQNRIHESLIKKQDLDRAEAFFLINAVRPWREAVLIR
ncbi:aminodeoxychorismate synthase component I [bacterium]|nr:aminodeoxychorismate synthase component I [bacterium]